LDLSGRKWQKAGEDCIVKSFIICKLFQAVVRVIKSRGMRRAEHVPRMGDMRNT
jgi:hypothetical protein